MGTPTPPQGLAVSLRGLAETLLATARVRLELLSVEGQEEARRLGDILLYGALAVVLLALGLGFLAILLTVLLWDSHRLLALAVFSTLFLTLGGVAARLAWQRSRQDSRLFASSIEELRRDEERLRP